MSCFPSCLSSSSSTSDPPGEIYPIVSSHPKDTTAWPRFLPVFCNPCSLILVAGRDLRGGTRGEDCRRPSTSSQDDASCTELSDRWDLQYDNCSTTFLSLALFTLVKLVAPTSCRLPSSWSSRASLAAVKPAPWSRLHSHTSTSSMRVRFVPSLF